MLKNKTKIFMGLTEESAVNPVSSSLTGMHPPASKIIAPTKETTQYVANLTFPIFISGLNNTQRSTKSAVTAQTETAKTIFSHQNTKALEPWCNSKKLIMHREFHYEVPEAI